jgi:hypothetical protein
MITISSATNGSEASDVLTVSGRLVIQTADSAGNNQDQYICNLNKPSD